MSNINLERRDKIKDGIEAGRSYAVIGQELGISRQRVHQIAREIEAQVAPDGQILSLKMAGVLRYLMGYIEREGSSPSHKQIQNDLGYSGAGGVVYAINKLESLGFIQKVKSPGAKKARGFKIIKDPQGHLVSLSHKEESING